jgi:hypothetical protein
MNQAESNAAYKALLKALHEKDHQKQVEAAYHVAETATPQMMHHIWRQWLGRSEEMKQVLVAGYMRQFDHLGDAVGALMGEQPFAQMAAAEWLAQAGDMQALGMLIEALEPFPARARTQIAGESLKKVGRVALPLLLARVSNRHNPRVGLLCLDIVEAMATLADIEVLIEIYQAADHVLIRNGLERIIKRVILQQTHAALPFVLPYIHSPALEVRKLMVEIISAWRIPQAATLLCAMLRDPDPFVCIRVIVALEDLKDERVVIPLSRLLTHEDSGVRAQAKKALAAIHTPEAQAIIRAWEEAKNVK